MKKGFSVQAILTRASSMVDGGLSLGLHTKELTAEEKVKIMDFHNQAGWLVFSANEVKDEDIPVQDAEMGGKTPSQRLRAVLYIMFDQAGAVGDFDTFYKNKMEAIIEHYKEKLNP